MARQISNVAKKGASKSAAQQEAATVDDGKVALPPDETLSSMDIVMTKRLTELSVQDFYELFWSEGQKTDKAAFYGPWLVDSGKMDVAVEDWTFASPNGQQESDEHASGDQASDEQPSDEQASDDQYFTGDWDKETYDQKRTVQFEFTRTTALYTGPPVASVQHTQYVRRQGNDRCIVATTMKMGGIPFADTFFVQVRWVATRVGNRDLSIKVGLFVHFVKQVIVAGKIRVGTTEETTKTQLDLFQKMKKVCGSSEDVVHEAAPPVELLQRQPPNLLSFCFPLFKLSPEYADDIERAIQEVRDKLRIVRTLPAQGSPSRLEENRKFIRAEFSNIQEALDIILVRNMASIKASAEAKPNDDSEVDNVSRVVNAVSAPFEKLYSNFRRFSGFPSRRPASSAIQRAETVQPLLEKSSTPPTPDKRLKAMNVILTKIVDNASVQGFYDICLSDLYETWLVSSGKTEVSVEDWVTGTETDGQPFIGSWDKESYSHKRVVTFNYERSSFILQGPAVASVKHTHYCRFDDDKCVLAMTIEPQGTIPFSDCFVVYIRWVVNRVGKDKVSVKVGLFVDFKKRVLAAGKIRAGATQEGRKQQLDLFRTVKAALVGPTLQESMHTHYGIEDTSAQRGTLSVITSPLEGCLPRLQKLTHLYPETMIEDDEELAEGIRLVEQKLNAVNDIVGKRDAGEASENMNFYLAELVVVREALDNIILWHGTEEQGPGAIADASFSTAVEFS